MHNLGFSRELFLIVICCYYGTTTIVCGSNSLGTVEKSENTKASSVVMVLKDCAEGPYGNAQEMRNALSHVTGGPYMCYSLFYGYLTYAVLKEYDSIYIDASGEDFATVMDWLGLSPSLQFLKVSDNQSLLQDFIEHGHRLWFNVGPTTIDISNNHKEGANVNHTTLEAFEIVPGATLHRQRPALASYGTTTTSIEVDALGVSSRIAKDDHSWQHASWLEIDSTKFSTLLSSRDGQRTLLAQGIHSKNVILSTLTPQQLSPSEHGHQNDIRKKILVWLHNGTSLLL